MPLIRALEDLNRQYPRPVLTIGNFDGVHLGHQALFSLVKKRAADLDGTSMVMTFEPHPIRVLTKQNGPPLITLYDQKIDLIQQCGIDVVICLDFTPELASLEPEDFIRQILVEHIGVAEIVIGYDYTFGRKARGNREMLMELGEQHGFKVHTVGPLPGPDGTVTSSTRIRDLVQQGEVEKVPPLLGRYYRIAGRVVRGRDRGGKLLGFPTANLRLVDELIPKTGVYAVRVTHEGQVYSGVANIGYNPTFGDVGLSVEVHCFDFSKSIYDQDIRVDFIARVRDEKKFSGPEDLAQQIQKDCQLAKTVLSESGAENKEEAC
jgi:riboflavin kinase/FMN adenylyltransferase